MKYKNKIENALANPGALVYRDGNWVPDINQGATGYVPVYGEHEYPITYPSREEIDVLPYKIHVGTPEEAEELAIEFGIITGQPRDLDNLRSGLDHEHEHTEVIRAMGGAALYSLTVLANKEANLAGWVLSTVPDGFKTTKIGVGVIAAYPSSPSPGDMNQIRTIGYKDRDEVSAIASQYNLPKLR